MDAPPLPAEIAASLTDPEVARRLALAWSAAREAGALLVAMRPTLGPADRKGRVDLVTEADRASERLLMARLASALPEDRFIGEEGAAAGPAEARWCWYLDPVDGTTNFVTGLPHFAVSVGATRDGVPAVGVVSAPVLGATWLGGLAQGAWRVDHASGAASSDGATDAVRRLAVAPSTNPGDVLAATGFPYDRSRGLATLLGQMARAAARCLCLRRLGSASLDLALVADGVLGVYWEASLKPWDYVAGVVLVREAGGRVTDHAGRDEAARQADRAVGPGAGRPCDGAVLGPDLAASNGLLHAFLLDEVVNGSAAGEAGA
jgi:myo-inositol-1(or 4)-monophosphatase